MQNAQHPNLSAQAISRRGFLAASGLGLTAFLAGCGSSSSGSSSSSSSSSSSASSSSSDDGSYALISDGKLTLVTELYYPPFTFMDDSGNPEGFDIDLFDAIADKMGLEPVVLPSQQFDTLIPTIKAGGTADITLGGMTITDEREKEIDFTDPYFDSNQALVVASAATDKTEDALNVDGKKIAVQSGTTGESWAQENFTKATIVTLDDVIQALTGVQTGLYDGCVCDLPVARYLIQTSYSNLEVPDGNEIPTGEQLGIAVSKDNPNLTKAINSALQAVKDDGTMNDLQTKWFGEVVSTA